MKDGFFRCATCAHWENEGELGLCTNEGSKWHDQILGANKCCREYEEDAEIYEAKERDFKMSHPGAVITRGRPTHVAPYHYIYLGGQFWRMDKPFRDQAIFVERRG